MKQVLKIAGYTVAAVLFLATVLAGLTQSKLFKDRLRTFLVATITKNTNASITLGTIRGNFVTGFSIDSLHIHIGDDEILSTGKIDVDYDFLSLPRKRIIVHRLTIHNPRFVLRRSVEDSVWNFSHLEKYPHTETTAPEPFDWTVQVDELSLINGSVLLNDQLALASPGHEKALPHQVEYHDFAVEDINLKCSGRYSDEKAHLSIKNLSFHSDQPRFTLKSLRGDFSISPSGTEVKSLTIETERTTLRLSARLDSVNMFDGITLSQLQHKPVQLTVLADNISLDELKSFLTPVDFLNGSVYVDLEAAGAFGDLYVKRLNVQTKSTAIWLSGSVQNLHHPADLLLNIDIDDSRITPADAVNLMPLFNLPRFDQAGSFQLNAKYVGKPLRFNASVQLSGEMGTAEAIASLNLEQEQMEYDCSFQTSKLNLPKLWPTFPLRAMLTSHGTVKGRGTSPEHATARLTASLDSTSLERMVFGESEVIVDVRNRAMTAALKLKSATTSIDVTTTAAFHKQESPSFDLDAEIANLDLSKVLDDHHFKSNISFRTVAAIRGSDIDNISGRIQFITQPSTFQTYEFGDETLELQIDQRRADSSLVSLYSPIAEVISNGNTPLSRLVELLSNEIQHLRQAAAVQGELFTPDRTTSAHTVLSKPLASGNQDSLDWEFNVTVKNLKPLSVFFGGTPFNGRGSLRGNVRYADEQFALACSASVAEIFVGTIEQGTLVEDADIVLHIAATERDRSTVTDYLRHLKFDFFTYAHNGIINRTTYDGLSTRIIHENNISRYELRGTVDSLLTIDTQGSVKTSPHRYDITVDSMTLAFGELSWQNGRPINILVDRYGFSLPEMIIRTSDESLTLQGIVGFDGTVDGQLTVRQFDLRGIGNYANIRELQKRQNFSGTVDLDASIKGTVSKPQILMTMSSNTIAYRGKNIGVLLGSLSYADDNLKVDVGVGNKHTTAEETGSAKPTDVFIRGNIPISLAFDNGGPRFPDKEIDLVITSDALEIDFLDPMLATFDDLRGKLSCNIHVGGTPNQPVYNGVMTFAEVTFLFVPNNLLYTMSGRLEASREKIRLVDVRIANSTKDRTDGLATVEGSLTIRNFTVESFDVTAHGQLLLMNEATRRTLKSVYGTLFASIGSQGLHYRGTFDQSNLSGTVYIKEANLVFPPTRESYYGTAETTLKYVVVDDTTSADRAQERLSLEFFGDQTNGNGSSANPVTSTASRTIWDGMWYDVLIETQGNAEIRMVFNQSTNEELFAALEGRVVLQRGERGPKMTGEIAVAERSYYNFFKKFSARGTLRFVGQPDNPELNITASYEDQRVIQQTDRDTTENVIVTLDITGTRMEPKLKMSMTVDGVARTGDVESDAIPFILTGKFRDDLTSQERTDILTNLGSVAGGSLLYGVPSQMLSGVLSDFLQREFPIIRRAEFTYKGGNIQESADLRLSGEIGKAYWRGGGRIFNDIGNANVSVQLSMGEVLESPSLRNLFIELERKVEGSESEERRKLTHAARIFFRISF